MESVYFSITSLLFLIIFAFVYFFKQRISLPENKGKLAFFGGIDKAKFRKQVVPGDRLRLETDIIKCKGPMGVGKAVATVDGKVACEAEIKFMIG